MVSSRPAKGEIGMNHARRMYPFGLGLLALLLATGTVIQRRLVRERQTPGGRVWVHRVPAPPLVHSAKGSGAAKGHSRPGSGALPGAGLYALTDLGTLGGRYSHAWAINASG